MKISHAAIAAVAAAVTGIGGGVAAAQIGRDRPSLTADPTPAQGSTGDPAPATAEPSGPSTPHSALPAPSPSTAPAPVDKLSEENVIRERLYFDVSGHSFTRVDPDPKQTLGPCTGERTFSDILPRRGVTRIGSKLVGEEDGLHVVEQLAQTGSAHEARAAAVEIVGLFADCAAIEGGDFGYGDPVSVSRGSNRKIVYFPAYDSDRVFGGYVVFSVGTRVGVIEVADEVSHAKIAQLAEQAATIAAG